MLKTLFTMWLSELGSKQHELERRRSRFINPLHCIGVFVLVQMRIHTDLYEK